MEPDSALLWGVNVDESVIPNATIHPAGWLLNIRRDAVAALVSVEQVNQTPTGILFTLVILAAS
jgi:hypothetical protein